MPWQVSLASRGAILGLEVILGLGSELIEIGKVVGLHGVKGDFKIYPWCDDPLEIVEAKRLVLAGEEVELVNKRVHKNIVLARARGAETVELARKFINKVIYIPRAEIKLKKGQALIVDLIGLEVLDYKNPQQAYGTVCDVIKTGANDVYVIENKEGKQHLIPAIKSVVNLVDIEGGVIKITPMKGLWGDED